MRERKLNRKKGYDYSQNGYYFVTICTRNRIRWFGEIDDMNMVLNNVGEIANQCFTLINEHFPHIFVDEFIVMPNHVHGILVIDNLMGINDNVGNNNYCSLRYHSARDIPWQTQWAKSISSAIRGYKIGVKKWCNQNGFEDFTWQKSFHDRIIRNEKEYVNIKNYIINNPINWDTDRFY